MFERLVQSILHMRTTCSVPIQRWWRGACERNVLVESRRKCILRWRFDGYATDVYVAGEFSDWNLLKMKWCPVKGEHRLAVQLARVTRRESFQYKFKVHGLWTCDGTFPMLQDGRGNINNVFYLPTEYDFTQAYFNFM